MGSQINSFILGGNKPKRLGTECSALYGGMHLLIICGPSNADYRIIDLNVCCLVPLRKKRYLPEWLKPSI